MSFLSRLFGKDQVDDAELLQQAEAFLRSLEDLLNAGADVKSVRKLYRKEKRFDRLLDEEGALHQRFLKLAFDLISREMEKAKLPVLKTETNDLQSLLPSVQRVLWNDELEDIETLFRTTESADAEALWVTEPHSEERVHPLQRITSLYYLAASEEVVLVLLDDGIPMVVRKSFLAAAHAELDGSIQMPDVGQCLMDLAKKKGRVVYNCWGR